MDLSPSLLSRILIERLDGQFANKRLCLFALDTIAHSEGKILFGGKNSRAPKDVQNIRSTLLQDLQKPAEILLGKDGVALLKECLPKKESVESEIKAFLENPSRSITKACRFIEGVLRTKTPE